MAVAKEAVFTKQTELVEREIEGELLIIPIMAGVGDADANLYSFNNQGADIWKLIDGTRTIEDIANCLCADYDVTFEQALTETATFMESLLEKKLIR